MGMDVSYAEHKLVQDETAELKVELTRIRTRLELSLNREFVFLREVAELTANNERLTAALKPFAQIANDYERTHEQLDHSTLVQTTLGMCLRAEQALAAAAAPKTMQEAS